MRVRVTGIAGPDRDELIRATEFYLNRLIKKDTTNLRVHVRVINKSPSEQGSISITQDYTKNPTSFRIDLKKRSYYEMYRTLAHECVHIKQFFLGQLKMNSTGVEIHKWGDKPVTGTPYWSSPWEKQAYSKEGALFFAYMETYYKCLP